MSVTIGGEGTNSYDCGSPKSIRRKPVPTPRSTLKKPRNLVLEEDRLDVNSEGQTSIDSTSPECVGTQSSIEHREEIGGVDGEDILTALEKIPGVGSLRSLCPNSPTVRLDTQYDIWKKGGVQRDDSIHSLGNTCNGNIINVQGVTPRGDSCVNPRQIIPGGVSNNVLHHTIGVRHLVANTKGPTSSWTKSLSSSGSSSNRHGCNDVDDTSALSSKILRLTNKLTLSSPHTLEATPKDGEVVVPEEMEMTPKRSILLQERPLPQLPIKRASSEEEEEIKVVSTDDIYTSLLTPEGHYCELKPARPFSQIESVGKDKRRNGVMGQGGLKSNGYLTMTGTIKRGKYQEKRVDLQLALATRDHLSDLEKRVHDRHHDRCFCGLRRGPHVFLLSILCVPFIWIYSTCLAFYLGSMTWYNIFLHYNEERSCFYKLLSPFVLLIYPLWIAPVTFFVGVYAAFAQISWYWDSWLSEVTNPDSGFMGWACAALNLPDCSPYQVVFLASDSFSACSHTTKGESV